MGDFVRFVWEGREGGKGVGLADAACGGVLALGVGALCVAGGGGVGGGAAALPAGGAVVDIVAAGDAAAVAFDGATNGGAIGIA